MRVQATSSTGSEKQIFNLCVGEPATVLERNEVWFPSR